jgi:hypothetical protein
MGEEAGYSGMLVVLSWTAGEKITELTPHFVFRYISESPAALPALIIIE